MSSPVEGAASPVERPHLINMLAQAERLIMSSAGFRNRRMEGKPGGTYTETDARNDLTAGSLLIMAAMQRPFGELAPEAGRIVQMLEIMVNTIAKETKGNG